MWALGFLASNNSGLEVSEVTSRQGERDRLGRWNPLPAGKATGWAATVPCRQRNPTVGTLEFLAGKQNATVGPLEFLAGKQNATVGSLEFLAGKEKPDSWIAGLPCRQAEHDS